MMKLLKSSGLLMLALLVGASTAFAAKEAQGVLRVEDKAKLFSAEGIKKAEDKFHDVTFKAKTHWTVVTMSDVPESKKADLTSVGADKNKAIRFFGDLASSMAKERNEVGVFTLVYNNGEKLIVRTVADKGSDLHRHFSDADATTLSDKLLDAIRAAKKKTGDDATTERDSGLMAGTSFVIDQLKDTSLPEAKKTAGSTVSKANNDVKASTGMSIGNWICIGLVAALSIWVVIALIRALTGGGGGGGYGGGGYGGGMGGGGMGFFGSFMTGMLGAAAGMWMYNNFMGGNHYGNDMAAGGTDGGDTGATDTGEGDFDGGAEGGGGDWDGGDAGGGADTGGGGDWGGDTGGGGDWGGGDAGGGGDFGGGGGDW